MISTASIIDDCFIAIQNDISTNNKFFVMRRHFIVQSSLPAGIYRMLSSRMLTFTGLNGVVNGVSFHLKNIILEMYFLNESTTVHEAILHGIFFEFQVFS